MSAGYCDNFRLLESYGIPVAECLPATTATEAAAAAANLGFPVALKVDSETHSHKTNVGGVVLDLNSTAEVHAAFREMAQNLSSRGQPEETLPVAVQAMAEPSLEVIIGMKRDPQFGPVIMFGLGGVLTEVLDDFALRIVPFSRTDAREMLDEIRGRDLLGSFRGRPGRDVEALIDCIMSLAQLAADRQDIQEIDLNPVIVYRKGRGIRAVDARITSGESLS